MNEKSHWDGMASRYEDEIFDVFRSDKDGKLPEYFRKHSNPHHTAIDFGCGVGKAFPYLSPLFGKIMATDISAECLVQAKARNFSNITLRRADLTRPGLHFEKADFGFCCNVVMLPEIEKNLAMLKNIHRSLKKGGSAVLVVPSLESILYSTARLAQWYRKEGVPGGKIPESELSYYRQSKRAVVQGIITIDGVPTKHYLETEIRMLFESAHLTVTAIDKIEYEWNTEFAEPPSWMGAPFPWDWLVEIKNSG